MAISFIAPDLLNGDQLAAEITAAGFSNVRVALASTTVEVDADGLVDPYPPQEVRASCTSLDEVRTLVPVYEATAAESNAAAVAIIGPLVAAHRPSVTD